MLILRILAACLVLWALSAAREVAKQPIPHQTRNLAPAYYLK